MDLKITIIISLWFVSSSKAVFSGYGNYAIIREWPFFVDKSEMLTLLFNSTLSSFSTPHHFVTCPYNFGKTVNLLMIKKFCEIEVDANHQPKHWMHTSAIDIFKDLKISQYTSIIGNHMSRYPVIYLDVGILPIAGIQKSGEMLMHDLRYSVVREYKWLRYLLQEQMESVERDFNIKRKDAKFFIKLFKGNITEEDLDDGLLRVCRVLYNYFNRTQVVLLVDEYEKVALRALVSANKEGFKFYEKLNTMLTRTLTDGCKYIKFAFMTGTGSLGFSLETNKYNLFAFFFGSTDNKKNDFIVHYPFLDNHQFSPDYGFVKDDVSALCNLSEIFKGYENALLSEAYWTVDKRQICNAGSLIDVISTLNYPAYNIIPFRWIESDFNKLLVPFKRSKVFREKMDDAAKYGYFQYPIKKTFPADGLEEMINLASNDYYKITKNHVDMFFTISFEQGYFTHLHGEDNFTFANRNMKTEIRYQLSDLVLAHPIVPEGVWV